MTGYVSVPREPTPEQVLSAIARFEQCKAAECQLYECIAEVIKAALAAAPMKLVEPKPEAKPVAWSTEKPTIPGAYWIRGYELGDASRTALVEVREINGELISNIHGTNSDERDFRYSIDDLNNDFEWLGPLYTHPPADEQAMKRDAERYRFIRAQHDDLERKQFSVWSYCDDPVECPSSAALDASIDEAIKNPSPKFDVCISCLGTGEDFNEGDTCHKCGGTGKTARGES